MSKTTRGLTPFTELHPRETLFVPGTLGSLNAEIIAYCDGAASFAVDLRGTFNLTFQVLGTVDLVNWTPIPVRAINAASVGYLISTAVSAPGVWAGNVGPYRQIKVMATAYTSGSATCVIMNDIAPLDQLTQGLAAVSTTVTGASGAIATLTLAAPGVGLRHYITGISIQRFAAAVLTASATPVVVTTTNLPGSLAFTFEADAAALGVMSRFSQDYAPPIAASAQNTATTIVAPVTTGVIWRVSATYYIAP